MSPRPYRLGQRQEAAQRTRARIISAARELLTAGGGVARFTIDAVAQQADVARMTVYYQFGSKLGLLEALFDDLAARGLVRRLPSAFARLEPLEALAEFIAVFSHFWASERLVIRRIRGQAALDPEIEQALRRRDEWRREGLRVILRRLVERYGVPASESFEETVDILHTLTSFETFDTLAGIRRTPEEVMPLVRRVAFATLGLPKR